MKKILLTVLFFALSVTVPACGKFGSKKGIAPEEAGRLLAAMLCEKHAGCQPPDSGFNRDQCLQEISTGLSERLKSRSDLKVDQAMIDACTKTVKGGDCSILTSEAPPAGCEFLE